MSKHIDLAKKIKALADRGVGGEKRTAEKLLDSFLKKHNLSIEDIENEEVSRYFFKADGSDAILLHQIIKRVNYDLKCYVVSKSKVRQWKLSGNNWTECTLAEFIEIEQMFSVYKRLYKSELDIFYHSFLIANDLLCTPPKARSIEELSDEEAEKYIRAQEMAANIKSETVRKQLTSTNP